MARQLIVELVGRSDQFTKSMDAAGSKLDSVVKKMGAAGTKMTKFVTLPIAAAGVAAFKAGSDMAESMNAADIAFKKDAREVQKWAKELDSAFGFSVRGALDAAAGFRLVTQDSDLSGKQITDLAERAADLGSVFNATSEDVSTAIKSALVGETEPMRRFGVTLNQASIEAKALAMGILEAGEEMTAAQKQAAIYAIIMEKTAFAQGDATNTADTAAGKMRVLKTELSRTSEEIGTKLIPAFVSVTEKLSGVLSWLENTGIGADKLLFAMLGLAAVGPILKGIELATKAVAAAQWAWNVAVAGHPLLAFTAATIAAAAAVERLTVDLFGGKGTLFSWNNTIDDITSKLRHMAEMLRGVGDAVRNLPGSGVLKNIMTVGGRLPFFHDGGVVPGPPGANVPIMAQAGETVIPNGRRASGGGGGVVINVAGSVITDRDLGRIVADALRNNALIGVS